MKKKFGTTWQCQFSFLHDLFLYNIAICTNIKTISYSMGHFFTFPNTLGLNQHVSFWPHGRSRQREGNSKKTALARKRRWNTLCYTESERACLSEHMTSSDFAWARSQPGSSWEVRRICLIRPGCQRRNHFNKLFNIQCCQENYSKPAPRDRQESEGPLEDVSDTTAWLTVLVPWFQAHWFGSVPISMSFCVFTCEYSSNLKSNVKQKFRP